MLPGSSSFKLSTDPPIENVPPKESSQLEFLNISKPQDIKTKQNRLLVRTHAMLDYRVRVRKKANLVSPQHHGGLASIHPRPAPTDLQQQLVLPLCSACVHTRYHVGKIIENCPLCQDILKCRIPSRICTCNASSESGPVSLLGAGRVDPFDSFSTSISPEGHKLLDHFVQVLAPLHVGHLGENFVRNMAVEHTAAAMAEPTALAAMFLLAARSFQSFYQVDVHNAARYRGVLIRQINEAMNDTTRANSDEIITSMCVLKYDEFFLRDYTAYEVHSKALKSIVEQRGGPYKLGLNNYTRDTILYQDICSTYIIGIPLYYEHNITPRKITSISNLPSGFQATLTFHNMSLELLGILDDLAHMLQLIESSPEHQLPTTPSSNEIVLHTLQSNLIILSDPDSSLRLNPHLPQPDVEILIALTSELFLERLIRAMPASDFIASWIPGRILHIVNSLTYSPWCSNIDGEDDESSALELLLWAVFVCGFCITRQETMKLWAITAGAVVEELGLGSWEEARAVLGRFLWISECEGWGRGLWEVLDSVKRGAGVGEDWSHNERVEPATAWKNVGFAVWNSLQRMAVE